MQGQIDPRDGAKEADSKKLFTLEQATRALPLVRRVVTDLVGEYRSLRKILIERRELPKQGAEQQIAKLDRDAVRVAERIGELAEELNLVGCEVKDCETGLIDFRALHEGREVYLCWRLGEDRIKAWHELDGGFAGRQPIETFDPDPCPAA